MVHVHIQFVCEICGFYRNLRNNEFLLKKIAKVINYVLFNIIIIIPLFLKVMKHIVDVCSHLLIILRCHWKISITTHTFQIKRRNIKWCNCFFFNGMYMFPTCLNVCLALGGQNICCWMEFTDFYPPSRLNIL